MAEVMPIRAENKHRYPKDWKAIVARIRERSGNRCEQDEHGGCGVANGMFRLTYPDGSEAVTDDVMYLEVATVVDGARAAKIVLTVAHLDHTPENCDEANLRHWCQRCHNRYDAPVRARGIKERRSKPLLEDA